MSKALPRSFKGYDQESRQVRRAAQRHSEKYSDDWRDDDACDLDEPDRCEDEDFDEDDRLEAATRRLARRSAPERDTREPRRWRDDAPRRPSDRGEPSYRRARSYDANERDFREEPAIDPEQLVEHAVENAVGGAAAFIEKRVAASERQTARALKNIAALIEGGKREQAEAQDGLGALVDRLGRIESKIGRQPPADAAARPIRSALARLESRIDRWSKDDRTAEFEQTLSGLDQRLADIARRLDEDTRERQVKEEARERQVNERQVKAAAFGGASHAAMDHGLRRGVSPRGDLRGKRPLADAIAEIARRQRALDEDDAFVTVAPIEPPAAPAFALDTKRLDDLQASVDAISRRLDAPRRDAQERDEHERNEQDRDEQQLLLREIGSLRREFENLARGDGPVDQTRFDALHGSVDKIFREFETARHDAGERANQQLVVMRQVEGLRREVEGVSRALGDLAPRASVASIETALRELVHRIDAQRDYGVQDHLLAPVERIAGELRAVIEDLDPSPIVRNLHADVETIGRRLDELQAPGAGDSAALGELARQTSEIRDLLTTLAARPLPLEKIETRLFDLTQRVDALSLSGATGAASKDIGEAVKAIRSIVAAETSNGFNAFNKRLEHLAKKLDDVLAKTGGKRFDEINERIEEMHKSLAQRIERGAAAQKPADTSALEHLVAKLAKKIDSALDPKASNPAFDELGRKIEKLEARLHDPAAGASIARIEAMLAKPGEDRRFSELAQRIDLIHKTLSNRFEEGSIGRDGADTRHIEDLARRLGDKLEVALEPGASRRDLETLEQQIEHVSQKLDRLSASGSDDKINELLSRPSHGPQIHELSERIDFMHNALAARIEVGVRQRVEASQSQLTELVDQLTRKMNDALDPKADGNALQALEKHIAQLSQRLDRNDGNTAALSSIERKIAELFARIEETRNVTTQAAELAVRRATQEILRDVASAQPGALNLAVGQEISEIRKTQDEAGQRTHETLSAVHETLERVVDRLAVFEDELTELRSEAPIAALAPAPMRETPRPRVVEARANDNPGDLLLEPGVGPRSRPASDLDAGLAQSARAALSGERPPSVKTDFIAAARRAAQQAAADADAAHAKAGQRGAERAEPQAASGLARAGASVKARKRPILLGLGALVLLVGAYQVAKVSIEGGAGAPEPAAHIDAGDASAPAAKPPADTAPAIDAPAPAKTPRQDAASPAASRDATPAAPATKPPPPSMTLPPGTGPGPSLAPKASGKSASDAVDSTPVGAINGSGASQPEAVAAIKSLAAQGDAAAQYELGGRFAEGRGMARDQKTAAQWFQKAAEQELAPAQYRLGSMYEKGIGVDRDYAQARKWYQRAADAGNARAMHNLAVLAAEGNDGKPDYLVASDWFRKAAEFGVRDSQYNLAILHARGLGVTQSLTHSYMWFAIAADQGDADAGKKRDEIGARLDSKELAAAKALVDKFKPTQPNRAANDVPPPRGGWENVRGTGAKPEMKPLVRPKVSRL